MNLFDLGERKIIEELKKLYGTIVDDDSYYFPDGKDYVLITTDVITKKTHIPDDVSPEIAGYFFASLNFSDIAAMGGRPKYFLASYSMRIDTDFDFFMEFNRGIKKCIEKYKTKMVGGDTKEGDDFTATGIAIGKVNRNYILLRRNFKEDQVVAVTNSLGKNAAGYYLWKNGIKEGAEKLLDIEPRIEEGIALSKHGAKAAMDLSDGVFSSIDQIKKLTGTGFKIFIDKIPIHPLAVEVSRDLKIPLEEISLNFGGDYELLFSVDRSKWQKLKEKMEKNNFKVSEIGETWKGENILVKEGKEVKIKYHGYEHFTRSTLL